jgi:hypothetical protein
MRKLKESSESMLFKLLNNVFKKLGMPVLRSELRGVLVTLVLLCYFGGLVLSSSVVLSVDPRVAAGSQPSESYCVRCSTGYL